jgi:hypothetical protein
MKSLLVCFVSLLLTACGSVPTEQGLKVVVGGALQNALGAETLPFSVIVIANGRIRDIGAQASTPVPKGAETISAKDKVIRPIPPSTALAPGQSADFILTDKDISVPDQIYNNGVRVK